jgi:hypothetical protein
VESRRRAHGRALKVDSARRCVVPSPQQCSKMSLSLSVYLSLGSLVSCVTSLQVRPACCACHIAPCGPAAKDILAPEDSVARFGWAERKNAQWDCDSAVPPQKQEKTLKALADEEDGAAGVNRGQEKCGRDRGAHEIKHCSHAPEHVF